MRLVKVRPPGYLPLMQNDPNSAPRLPGGPQRVLGSWSAVAVVVGMVVGAGIFRTSPLVAQSLGGDAELLLAWALGGAFALLGALCYAELSAAFPAAGGDYRFLREAFGRDLAYLFAWSRFSVISRLRLPCWRLSGQIT